MDNANESKDVNRRIIFMWNKWGIDTMTKSVLDLSSILNKLV